jgi:deoxycytidylate deaminase
MRDVEKKDTSIGAEAAAGAPSVVTAHGMETSGDAAPLGLTPPAGRYETFSTKNSELVIGIVGPLGTDNEKVRRFLGERLKAYGYQAIEIRLSTAIIPGLAGPARVIATTEYERATRLIDLGNQIRKESKNKGVLAIAAAAEIARLRPNPDGEIEKVAYVITSLKRKEEVAELRRIYGNGFYLFAVHSDISLRLETLMARRTGMQRWQAEELIERDEHEADTFGQDTRGTFHLADFFLADENNDDKLRNSIERCLDLAFGHPHLTPTFNEFAMFMAFASSVRSADLSRQVGAVVARGTEILSTGANDCPAAAGGLYWPQFIGDRIDDLPRGRDYKRGFDSNVVEKRDLMQSIVRLFPAGERTRAEEILRDSQIQDITEYGRVVHAEMEALLACARSQISCVGATLYCTTFPCHNCAKHIIAAGIEQVVYVEPYPKSKALKFHDDSATTGKAEAGEKKVRFKPFIGVGPRRFFDLFSVSLSEGHPVVRKDDDSGAAVRWTPESSVPRMQMLPFAHRRFEDAAVKYLWELVGRRGTL